MGAMGFGRARAATVHVGGRRRLAVGVLGLRGLGCLAVLLGAVLVLTPASAAAESLCTDTWVGPAEGLWRTAADWSGGTVPTSTDVACIGSGKTVKITEGTNQTGVVQGEGRLKISEGSLEVAMALEVSAIAKLTISGGELTGAGVVEITNALIASGGSLKGSGALVIQSGATAAVETTAARLGRSLTNYGSFTIAAFSGLGGEAGAKFVNDGTLTVQGGSEIDTGMYRVSESGTRPAVVNYGTMQHTIGTATILIAWSIANDGTVSSTTGTLDFTGGGASGTEHVGSWSATSGGRISLSGPAYSLGSTVPIEGAMTFSPTSASVTAGKIEGAAAELSLPNGTLELQGPAVSTIKKFTLKGGELTGAGETDVTESFIGTEGLLTGTGVMVIEPTAVGKVEQDIQLNRKLENKGSFTVVSNHGIGGKGSAVFINSGILTVNGVNGEFPSGLYVVSGTPRLVNIGTLQKTEGAGRLTIAWAVEDYGSIIEQVGNFHFTDPIVLAEPANQYGGSGNPSASGRPHPTCGDPVSCATGNDTETQTDLSISGRGVGLVLSRTYNSQAGAEGAKSAFGYGWSGSFSDHLVINKTSKVTTLHQANGSTVPFTEGGEGTFTAPVWTQDTLSGTPEAGYTLTLANQTKYKFAGSSGRLESVTDRDGNATTLTYNGGGQLTTITDPVSRTIKFTYNGEGLIESAEDPMKHIVKYTYEGGNLKSVTQPGEAGLRWQFKYDGSHELTEMTDGRGGKTVNEYNGSHQVTLQKDPAGHELSFEYEAFRTKITNKTTGSVTDERFTSNDEPFSITRGLGTTNATTESFSYNEGGYATSVTDGNGHMTKYGYSAANDRTSMVDPNKNETKWTYDSTHDVETMTTPKGETTTIKREAHGNPETIERPAPESKTQTTKYKYKTTGELESVEDPLKRVWKYEYDAYGDRTGEIDPEGDKRTWEYNEDSQETATVSPRGNTEGAEAAKYTTKTERDAQDRALKVTDPLGHTTKYKYDGDGNVESVTDGNSHTTTYTYNGDNEPTKVEAPNKAITETEYDGAGQIVGQTDGNKNTTKYKRNAVEEVTEVTDPLGRTTKKEYDAAGNLKTVEDPAKRTTTYKYDPANRLEEIGYSDGITPTVKYEYDADGDRTKMVDGTGTTKYAYDQLDRLTESENGHKEISKYEYDLANQQTKITYPNGKAVERAYDKAGRLEKVTDWLEHTTAFSYDPDSNLTTTTFPSGTGNVDKDTYNEADQMSEVQMTKGAETLASLVYTHDSDGQVKKTTGTGLPGAGVTEDAYDENNRLTESGSEYKYDSANNPTTIGAGAYKYDKADELETGPSLTYTYNELGERTKTTPSSGPTTTYGYDQAGNLVSVERPKEGETSEIKDAYAYDGNGLRASQAISGTTTHLAWDMTEGLPLILSDETNSYIYGPGGIPIEQVSSGGTVTYLHHDQQGSIRLLTGSAGTATGSITFDAYGNKVESTGATTPLGYDGQYTSSDTGLIYMRARVYDPATVQFLSIDPLAAITRAFYTYTNNDPLNFDDPTGLAEQVCMGATVTIILTLEVNVCVVSTPGGPGATISGGAGYGPGVAANVHGGAGGSNAQSPGEYGGAFANTGGSAQAGLGGYGGAFIGPPGVCGEAIVGGTAGPTLGVGAEAGAGGSYTFVIPFF